MYLLNEYLPYIVAAVVLIQYYQLDMKDEEVKTAQEICANCGKAGSNLNICNKCNEARYCNATCKKKHKKKHKAECEKAIQRAAELHEQELKRAAELHDIELFKQPPTREDCPICFALLPCMDNGRRYMPCCGKEICSGCAHAPVIDHRGNRIDKVGERKCAFCRVPETEVNEEIVKRFKLRMKRGDALAFYGLGCMYFGAKYGLRRDVDKAFELWLKAAELGCATAHRNIGIEYMRGSSKSVRKDEKKAAAQFELAAMKGDEMARGKLGDDEYKAGNIDRAIKHFLIAVSRGSEQGLSYMQGLFNAGHVSKDDYASALRARQAYLDEIITDQRDEAAAFGDQYKYY